MSSHEEGKGPIFAAFCANMCIAIAKFVAFAFTGSASMLAEGVHSVADTGNQGLLLVGRNRAQQPPDDQHPFGYGRERYFWAFVVSMVLFSVGSLFALYEGAHKLTHPQSLDGPNWAIGVLVFSIVAEGLSFRTAYREAKPVKGPHSWVSFIRRTKNPDLSVVLLEDSGALIGLLFAMFGVVMAEITDNARWDAIGSLAIGILLGCIAFVLARENKSLLIGEAATPETTQAIRHAITNHESVEKLIHLRTLQLGPDELLIAAKVDFGLIDSTTLAGSIDNVEVFIRNAVPTARLIFLEPDRYRADHS